MKSYVELFGSAPKDVSIWPRAEEEEESDEDGYDYIDDMGCG